MSLQSEALTPALSASNRVLIVAHDEGQTHPLRQSLNASGFSAVEIITDARKALPAFRLIQPDVVLIDEQLDHMDAFTVMKQIAARIPANDLLTFVVLTEGPDRPAKRAGAEATFSVFYADATRPDDVAALVRELANVRARSLALARAAERREAESRKVEAELARHLASFTEFKDHPGSGHVQRVGHLSALIALVLGFPAADVEIIRLAAPLHDVGKLGIPESILLKEEPLTLEEMDLVKTHTTLGASILAGSGTRLFQMAEEIALYHHENWDGTGYTPGLEGQAIPLVGRIVRVTDAFDSMTQSRPFAEEWRKDSAIEFIRGQAGHSFDPRVVDAFLEVQAEAVESAAEIRGLI
jgi:putative two-component system response regulator